MSSRIPMTVNGYNKLKAELDRLEGVELPKVSERVAHARSEGDLKENAEYHGARETQGMLQAKINQLKDKLNRAALVDTSKLPKDEVCFGCTVRVRDTDMDEEEEFTLVGAGEEDYETGKILANSPLAMGLVGKKVGDKVSIQVPKGKLRFEILEIRFEDPGQGTPS